MPNQHVQSRNNTANKTHESRERNEVERPDLAEQIHNVTKNHKYH